VANEEVGKRLNIYFKLFLNYYQKTLLFNIDLWNFGHLKSNEMSIF